MVLLGDLDAGLGGLADRFMARRQLLHHVGRIRHAIVRLDRRILQHLARRARVSDNGPGVPKKHQAEIFDRFNRGTENQIAGSGLGLSIVKAVAERYGGTIVLVPSARGACFELRLPMIANVIVRT